LPGFLVPAFQTPARRNFSATTARSSKLGRTPLSVPPGVDLAISDLFVKKDMTSYLKNYRRKITVKGPLGEHSSPVSRGLPSAR
jgi:large subunit ribosomal protein L6